MTTEKRKTSLSQHPRVGLDVGLKLTEPEARALHALTVYGSDAFLKNFYNMMGVTYLRPHEAGLRSLFETVGRELPPIIRRLDNAKRAFAYVESVVMSREEYERALKNAYESGEKNAKQSS